VSYFEHAATNQLSNIVPYFGHPTTSFDDLHPLDGSISPFQIFFKKENSKKFKKK
jgi:hypothetical protein